jgi:uncharacterized membrane protein YcaP (DUF421 family)
MWTLTTPWYELVGRGFFIYVFMFILMRVWGRKHIGEMTAFDFILLLFMSEAVQNSLVDDDKSLFGGMIVVLTFVLLNTAINKLSYRFRWLEKVFEGTPKVLVRNGVIDRQELDHQKMTESELMEGLRLEGIEKVKDVKRATLESNGHISVIEK